MKEIAQMRERGPESVDELNSSREIDATDPLGGRGAVEGYARPARSNARSGKARRPRRERIGLRPPNGSTVVDRPYRFAGCAPDHASLHRYGNGSAGESRPEDRK